MKWSQPADQRVVQLVVDAFRNDVEDLRGMLMPISLEQWQRSYYWLDASGIALYLLHRLKELDLVGLLPLPVLARLSQNFADNTRRSASMFHEYKELNQAFQEAGVTYCNLKGFTLCPHSCPDPALRTQLDFDFLVDGNHLVQCREVVSNFGYKLRAETNTVLEFKTDSNKLASIDDLYKPREHRSVELHFQSSDGASPQPLCDQRLQRLSWQLLSDFRVPTLSPVEQFIGQATHILSHLCGPSTRLAWLLEFANHLTLRFGDESFLESVLQQIDLDRSASIAVGSTCLLAKNLFGCRIPDSIRIGSVDNLPATVRLWVNRYGVSAVLANAPGTKLHLLLREQLEPDLETWRKEKSKALLPLNRPPRILHLKPGAGLGRRVAGELYQLRYDLFRLRFHLFQGLAYLVEARRWRRLLRQQELSPTSSAVLRSEVVPSR